MTNEYENRAPEADDLQTREPEIIDVAIIGAGPAGMTAGLYAGRAGLTTRMFEAMAFGGQLAQTSELQNYPGYTQDMGGFQLAMEMKQQAESFGAQEISQGVTSVDLHGDPKVITTAQGRYLAKTVIVATGSRPRKLDVPGEAELTGKGVSYCATCDGFFFRGKAVAVVGGGDTAAADALYLSKICSDVYVIHRRDQLRASHSYQVQMQAASNIHFIWNTVVDQVLEENGMVGGLALRPAYGEGADPSAIAAAAEAAKVAEAEAAAAEAAEAAEAAKVAETVENVEALVSATPATTILPVSGLFVAVGTVPNTEFLAGELELSESGHVVADESGKTSVPGVFAAGDVRTKTLRQVTTAVGDGANAATAAAEYLF